jgi:hypothetical protein
MAKCSHQLYVKHAQKVSSLEKAGNAKYVMIFLRIILKHQQALARTLASAAVIQTKSQDINLLDPHV